MIKGFSGWHPADVAAAIKKRGKTLTAVAQEAGLADAACRNALSRKHRAGELAISAFLEVHPSIIWPDRWMPDGTRIDHRFSSFSGSQNRGERTGYARQKRRAA